MKTITTVIGYWATPIPSLEEYMTKYGYDASDPNMVRMVREHLAKIEKENTSNGLQMPIANTSDRYRKAYALELLDKIESDAFQERKKGQSTCRICGCQNGSGEYVFRKVFKHIRREIIMPSGYRHYIEKHNVSPDTDSLITFATLLGIPV
jgi:hypothetical protein